MRRWYSIFCVLFICSGITLGQQHGGNEDLAKQIEESCGSENVDTLCIGMPKNCYKEKKPCESLVAITKTRGKYIFRLFGPRTEHNEQNPFVGVALSKGSKQLANSSIVQCDEKYVKVWWSANDRKPHEVDQQKYVSPGPNSHPGLQAHRIVCSFRRDVVSTEHKHTFDLNNQKFYVILISGELNENELTIKKMLPTDEKTFLHRGVGNNGFTLYGFHSVFLVAFASLMMSLG